MTGKSKKAKPYKRAGVRWEAGRDGLLKIIHELLSEIRIYEGE